MPWYVRGLLAVLGVAVIWTIWIRLDYESLPDWYQIALLIVIGVALWGSRHAGEGAKWATRAVVIFAFFVVIFGEKAFLITDKVTNDVTAWALGKSAKNTTGPIRFDSGETLVYAKFVNKERTVYTPRGTCVGYSPDHMFTMTEATSTYYTLLPKAPVVGEFEKIPISDSRCRK